MPGFLCWWRTMRKIITHLSLTICRESDILTHTQPCQDTLRGFPFPSKEHSLRPFRCRSHDSSVSIATRYGLDGLGIESRWGARFSALVQTGPGAQPASYTMGTGPFRGVKRPGRQDHPLPASAEVNERVELYLYAPYGPSWTVLG